VPIGYHKNAEVRAAAERLHDELGAAGIDVLMDDRDERPGVLFAVEDDGPGIAPERIAYVLQRGVRGDERVQGHGIGLAIVQDMVRSYRGELSVGQSQELGGARFEVTLPPGL